MIASGPLTKQSTSSTKLLKPYGIQNFLYIYLFIFLSFHCVMMCIGWHINPPPLNVAWEHMDEIDHLDVINLMDESLMTSMKLITSWIHHIIYINGIQQLYV